MRNFAPEYDCEKSTNFFGQAKVLSVDREKRKAKVYLNCLSGIQEIYAVLAIPYDCHIDQGDEVLVAGETFDAIYVIGILTAKSGSALYSDNGSQVVLGKNKDSSIIQIYSKQNELVVEYDTETENTRVKCLNGNLEIEAPDGNITFKSKETIELNAENIRIKGTRGVETSVQDYPGNAVSSLSLNNHQVKLNSPDFQLMARRGNFYLEELRITGKRVLGRLVQATIKVDRLETKAQSIINKTKNLYQTVENLSQLKTGRLKALVKSTYHLKSKNSILKSEDDFKIKAEKINLG